MEKIGIFGRLQIRKFVDNGISDDCFNCIFFRRVCHDKYPFCKLGENKDGCSSCLNLIEKCSFLEKNLEDNGYTSICKIEDFMRYIVENY